MQNGCCAQAGNLDVEVDSSLQMRLAADISSIRTVLFAGRLMNPGCADMTTAQFHDSILSKAIARTSVRHLKQSRMASESTEKLGFTNPHSSMKSSHIAGEPSG